MVILGVQDMKKIILEIILKKKPWKYIKKGKEQLPKVTFKLKDTGITPEYQVRHNNKFNHQEYNSVCQDIRREERDLRASKKKHKGLEKLEAIL